MLLPDDPAHAFMPYPAVPVPHAPDGPLAGLTFAAKDLFDVAGYRTGCGSATMLALSEVRTGTAQTVQRLLDAGARFVGKAITDELAFSMSGKNAHFGTPVNGAAPDRIPGGSSSGSASAVSSGLCHTALGTDTGGSVRAPASHCGLYGIRPTHGRISLQGCHDLSPSFDTCGLFARDAGTFARVADVLLGADPAPLPERPRLLRATDLFAILEAPALAALETAVARVAAACGPVVPAVALDRDRDALYWAYRHVQGHEAWQTDGPMITRYRPVLGPGVAERFDWCSRITVQQLEEGRAVRQSFRRHLAALLGSDGVLVLPTMPDIAPLLTDSEESLDVYRNRALHLLCLAGMSGFPQMSMPLATRAGAPLGLSLLGPAGSDRSLVAMARRIATS